MSELHDALDLIRERLTRYEGEGINVTLLPLAEATRAIGTGALVAMASVCTYSLARQAFPDLPWE